MENYMMMILVLGTTLYIALNWIRSHIYSVEEANVFGWSAFRQHAETVIYSTILTVWTLWGAYFVYVISTVFRSMVMDSFVEKAFPIGSPLLHLVLFVGGFILSVAIGYFGVKLSYSALLGRIDSYIKHHDWSTVRTVIKGGGYCFLLIVLLGGIWALFVIAANLEPYSY